MSARENLSVSLRLLHDLKEELGGFAGSFVGSDLGENHQRSRSLEAGSQRVDHLTNLCLCAPRVAGLEVQIRRVHRPPPFILGPIVGRQLSGAIEQERCRPRRPPRSRTTRRLVDDRRNLLVGLHH